MNLEQIQHLYLAGFPLSAPRMCWQVLINKFWWKWGPTLTRQKSFCVLNSSDIANDNDVNTTQLRNVESKCFIYVGFAILNSLVWLKSNSSKTTKMLFAQSCYGTIYGTSQKTTTTIECLHDPRYYCSPSRHECATAA